MANKNYLYSHHIQIIKAFYSKFPIITKIARESKTNNEFKENLRLHLLEIGDGHHNKEAINNIINLIDYDSKTVNELSIGEDIHIETINILWNFLRGNPILGVKTDFLLDIFNLFCLLDEPKESRKVHNNMEKWPSGLNRDVQNIRALNKDRMIKLLIAKIDKKDNHTKYKFSPDLTQKEKYDITENWWNSYQFHLAMAIKDPNELNKFLDYSLQKETLELLITAKKKGVPFFITPYYASLLNVGEDGYDDLAIRSYIIYSEGLINTFGTIKAWEKEDVVVPGEPNAAGWVLPEGGNIHRRYPEVAILIPDSMGRACGGICASCQRMYGFQSKQLNFDFEALKPKESWDLKLQRLMNFFEKDPYLEDILITGGDAFMSMNSTLKKILDAVLKMGIKKGTMKRVRLGSRLLAYLPMRVNDELIKILKEFREKAIKAGFKHFVIQTHFQSPLELTPEAVKAIRAINSTGWVITNQLVFNVASSRRGHTSKLRRVLNKVGVICYYTFTVKGFGENYDVFAPNSRSLQEAKEEKVLGRLTNEQKDELMEILTSGELSNKDVLKQFLKKHDLPFLATDRNVLNLPAIGKSMTFQTVGITKDGRRILKFDHDHGRKHSPIINNMGDVFIVENKSIGAYLRQLDKMGENIKDYSSIWRYTKGETEQRFDYFSINKI